MRLLIGLGPRIHDFCIQDGELLGSQTTTRAVAVAVGEAMLADQEWPTSY